MRSMNSCTLSRNIPKRTSGRIGKINGIFAPMSVGAHPRRSPHLDAASHLGTAFSLLIPVEIFCLYTAHMCSIVKHISCHIYTLDPGRRRHAWHLLWRPTHPARIDTMLVRWFPQRVAVGKLLFHHS